jgi:hypothetical protein
LTGKLLQLVHHGIDCALEESDFRVHFLSMDQNLFAQIAHSNSCNNSTDLTQSLLESQVCLLMLPKLALQSANILDTVLEYHVLIVQLLVDLSTQIVDVFALILNLVGLLVQMVAKVVELLFCEGSSRLLASIAIGLLRGEPVADPQRSLLPC